ncbi:MAG: putative toxin-antitoxin system toxin component, PIN family [Rhodocyclaceae bacterium]|nr:putative toxin-antitoxin system toxin component, PIN family [Rhodocyclaceae bacterium]
MKVFLDTNVLASALATRGLCAELFEAVLVEHELLASEALLEELFSILMAKLGTPCEVAAAYVQLLRDTATLVEAAGTLPAGIPDPDDAPLVAAAVAAEACFVTGDKALLAWGETVGLPILSPRQFWERTRFL